MTGPASYSRKPLFDKDDIMRLAAYAATLGPGPGLPASQYLKGDGNLANGAALFKVNCAMCHNVAGAGGALTAGKTAPKVTGIAPINVYSAMITGPDNMPVFNDQNISPQDKADIITYLKYLNETPSVGGLRLGSLGPVSEGLVLWIIGLGAIVAFTVWITAKSN
jgi:ubiquinol-cytochrome c reductase cytochrome c subunit